MLKLQKLKFKGFGRFVEQQEIDLTALPSVVQVDGQNNNTGGSSGAGKSTIFRVNDFLLGISDFSLTLIKSRYSKGYEAEGHYLWKGRPLVIKRASKGGASVSGVDPETNKEFEISGSASAVDEFLSKVKVLPDKIFKKMTHKAQGEGGFFLAMTPSESHAFMMQALNLEHISRALDAADEEIQKLTQDRDRAQQGVDTCATALSSHQEALKNAPQPPSQEKISTLEAQKEAKTQEIEALKKTLSEMSLGQKNEILALKKPEKPKIDENQLDLKRSLEIESHIASLESQIRDKLAHKEGVIDKMVESYHETKATTERARVAADRLVEVKKEILKVKSDLDAMKKSKCPTCSQDWLQGSQEAIKKVEKTLGDLVAKAQAQKALADQYGDLKAMSDKVAGKIAETKETDVAAELNDQLTKARADLAVEQARLKKQESELYSDYTEAAAKYTQKLEELHEKHRVETEKLNNALSALSEEGYQISHSLSYLLQEAKNVKAQIESAKKSVKDAETGLERAKAILDEAEKELELSQEAKRLLKSYSLRVFEDALSIVGERATDIVSKIPNMATASIRFDSAKELATKGKIKEELSAYLCVDSDEGIPIKSLSGGERAAIDLAVDLAVIDMLEERSGVGTDYFVLDEPCTGMDSVSKEGYVEVIRSCGSKKRIIIVDHSPEIKEMVQDKIVVARDGLYSKIEMQG